MRAAPAPTAGRRWPGLPRLRPPPGRSPAGVLTWAGGRGAPGCLGTSWQWTWSLSPKVPSPRPLSGLRKGDSHHGAWLRYGPRRGVLGRFHLPTPWALLDVSPRHGHGATENKGSLLSLWVPPQAEGLLCLGTKHCPPRGRGTLLLEGCPEGWRTSPAGSGEGEESEVREERYPPEAS